MEGQEYSDITLRFLIGNEIETNSMKFAARWNVSIGIFFFLSPVHLL